MVSLFTAANECRHALLFLKPCPFGVTLSRRKTRYHFSSGLKLPTPSSNKTIIFVGTVVFRIFIYHPIILGRLAVHVVLNSSNSEL